MMNKLDELIKPKVCGLGRVDKNDVKKIALEFAKHILEEASLNANMSGTWGSDVESTFDCINTSDEDGRRIFVEVNKESITSVIKRYE